MSITWVNNSASISNTGSSTLNLAYPNPNTLGNMGVCWCFTGNGSIPGSLTDSNGNTWCQINFLDNPTTYRISVFVCMNLAAGANTVTAVFGDAPISGTPSMHIHEYVYTGPAFIAGISMLYDFTLTTQTGLEVLYAPYNSGSLVNCTVGVFLAIYDFSTVHGWTSTAPSVIRAGANESTLACNVSGDSIISSGGIQTLFDCQFASTVITPPPNNRVLGFVVVTPHP